MNRQHQRFALTNSQARRRRMSGKRETAMSAAAHARRLELAMPGRWWASGMDILSCAMRIRRAVPGCPARRSGAKRPLLHADASPPLSPARRRPAMGAPLPSPSTRSAGRSAACRHALVEIGSAPASSFNRRRPRLHRHRRQAVAPGRRVRAGPRSPVPNRTFADALWHGLPTLTSSPPPMC